jgi:hypothetical protein
MQWGGDGHAALLQASQVTGLVISGRLWRFIEWPLIALGIAYVLALFAGLFLLARALARRWRGLWRRQQRRLLSLELVGTVVVLGAWYLGSRVVP